MNDYFEFKNKIQELVKAWNTVIKPGIEESGQYGETNTRKYLIDPILDALNWVDDGSKKIIDNEFSVKHKTGTGSADYALKVNGIPKILVEAKDVAKIKDLENGYDIVHGIKRTYPRQLSNYCHDLNHQGFDIRFSILTNGREWVVYNMKYADISSEREIIFRLSLEELDKDENLKKLWALEYNDICGDYHNLREIIQQLHDFRFDIDKKAVQQLLECKDLLSNSIFNDYEKNKRGIKDQIDDILEDKEQINGMPLFKEIPEEERFNFFIKEASSSIINKVLFIRILEDKNFLTPKLTKRSIEKWKDFFGYKDYDEIMNLFRESCRITEKMYNGGLFRLNPYDKVEYNPDVIKKIIDILGDINFREIDSDIIGRIYEIYLGQVLKVESEIRGKKRTKYKADNKERKKLGQYYTPKFVVDFIVQNTLGKLIEGKKPEEISKIRILDPACGSGSFLINAYDALADYFENWNNEILKKIAQRNRKNGAKITNYSDTGAVPKYKNIVLKENLHGVDLNDLSVQICEINLWLRALERDKRLIKLNKNILHGNSLITGVENEEELSKFKDELEDIKKRQQQIKEYYDEDEIPRSEEKRLEALERNLKFIKNNVNEKLNENLKDYFDDHVGNVHPFNWEVEFPEVMQERGVDIVIGNPPYINVEKLECEQRNFYLDFYNSAIKRFDIYVAFIEKGLSLLKPGGRLSFIIPYSFLNQNYCEKLREIILDSCIIETIIDFRNMKVFEDATVKNCVIVLKKCSDVQERKENRIKVLKVKDQNDTLLEEIEPYYLKQSTFYETPKEMIRLELNEQTIPIINKIKLETIPLSKICYINWGLRTGNIKKYVVKEKRDSYCKPMLDGRDIDRYSIRYDDKYVLYKKNELYNPMFEELFENEKIIIRDVTGDTGIRATYDNAKFYTEHTISICTLKHHLISVNRRGLLIDESDSELSKKFDIKYILGLINSKLINFYFKIVLGCSLHVYPNDIGSLPIKKIDKNKQVKIVELVELELNNKKRRMMIVNLFNQALSNQTITEPKSCNFGRYFDSYDLYGIQRETFNKINEIKAKLHSVDVIEDGQKLRIFVTIYNESNNQLRENIKAIELTIEDEDVRKFLFLSLKKAIDDKSGKGFGTGNILNLIKKIYVSFYVTNVKMNIEKIKEVMKEFNNNTKELWWKSKDKKEKFNSLTKMEDDIEKIDGEIDEFVYKLYGITEEEKKIIEDSLK